MLLPFEAKAESLFDPATGRLLSLTESNEQRNKRSAHAVSFDYAAAQALYTRTIPAQPPRLRSRRILARLAERVLAERRVAVGLVEQRDGHRPIRAQERPGIEHFLPCPARRPVDLPWPVPKSAAGCPPIPTP
jgi:hypothetical protein